MDNSELKLDTTKYGKKDRGKDRITLCPTEIIRDISRIRMFGSEKYTDYSWVTVEKERYKDALLRHILAYLDDEKSIDDESGLPHLWHAACNMAFLCEMERADWELIKQKLINRDQKLQDLINNKGEK